MIKKKKQQINVEKEIQQIIVKSINKLIGKLLSQRMEYILFVQRFVENELLKVSTKKIKIEFNIDKCMRIVYSSAINYAKKFKETEIFDNKIKKIKQKIKNTIYGGDCDSIYYCFVVQCIDSIINVCVLCVYAFFFYSFQKHKIPRN